MAKKSAKVNGHGKKKSAKMKVFFAFDGVSYTVDLSEKKRKKFAKVLVPYIAKADRVPEATTVIETSAPTTPSTSSAPSGAKVHDVAAVRHWAAANGITVGASGPLPRTVLAQYRAAIGS